MNTFTKILLACLIYVSAASTLLAIDGKIEFVRPGNVLILSRDMQPHMVALTNYPHMESATFDKYIHCNAKKVGIYQWGGMPLELWEYSTNQPPAGSRFQPRFIPAAPR